jgi:3-hydroxyisobutyrate dehydrogenase-like beta-hydroxyacid dehydrogenase
MAQNLDQVIAQGMDAATLHIWEFDSAVPSVNAALKKGIIMTSFFSPVSNTGIPVARSDEAGVSYLRAPVSGNPGVVRAGNLTFMVSGPREVLEAVDAIIRAIGPTVHYVGEAEQARVVKLAINTMIAVLVQTMSEAVLLGEASGVSREAILEVMGSSAVGAPLVKYKSGPLLQDDYSATFTTALMEKDIDLALDAAEEAGVELPLAQEMKQHLRATIENGYGDDDFLAPFQHLRHACGLATADASLWRATQHPDKEVVR